MTAEVASLETDAATGVAGRTRAATTLLVGDLHLTDVPTPAAARIAALADRLATRDGASLVLMGDVFDLVLTGTGTGQRLDGRLAADDGAAQRKLARIACANGEIFAAIGRLALAGGRVDLVTGNHDQELARPAVQRRIRELALPADAPFEAHERIAFHPFALYVPGVLYAEHGHRYHAINAAPAALRAHLDGGDEPISRPLGSLLTAIIATTGRDARSRVREAARLGPSLVRALGRTLAARQRPPARSIGRDRGLRARVAEATGLPGRAVAAIDELAPSESGIGRLLGRRAADEPGSVRAARRVHAALAAEAAAAPFYVFGHTHAADRRPLAADAEYLNAGAFGLLTAERADHAYVIIRQRLGKAPLARLCDAGDGPGAPTP